jgi:O-antigen/teichoic acid export membrane protein
MMLENASIVPLRGMARRLLGREGAGSLPGQLVRGTGGTLGLKIAFSALSFAASVLLARMLGAAGFGAFAFALATVGLLSVLARMGLDVLLVREVAAYRARSDWGLMHGLLRRANQTVLAVSLALVAAAAAISWALEGRVDPGMQAAFRAALILLPLLGLVRLRQTALQGLQQVVVGQAPELLILPALFFAGIVAARLVPGGALTAPGAVGLNFLASAVAFLVGAGLLRRGLPREAREAAPEYRTAEWLRGALPLLFMAGMGILNDRIALLLLGAMKGAEAVGVYSVVSRGAELIPFLLVAVNQPLAPTIAGLYAKRDMRRLQQVMTRSAQGVLLVSLPVGLGLIAFGGWFLRIFGEEFTAGRAALAVLSTGQLVNVATGSVGVLLIMTGHERAAARGIAIVVALNLVLGAVLIPGWGVLGAAVAGAAAIALNNVLLVIWAYRRIGIHATAFGRISWPRGAAAEEP